MLEYPNEQINASYEGYKDYINRIDSLAYSGGGARPPSQNATNFVWKGKKKGGKTSPPPELIPEYASE